jgi:uncharacterized protein (DUF1697 family)
MTCHIALLRGINLGPHRRVGMSDLRDLLTSLGHRDVRTYLQSGNVLFTSDVPSEQLRRELEHGLATSLGIDAQVVMRTREELADVVARNPLGGVAVDPKRYQVSFLSAEPDPEAVREISAVDVAPERLVVSGRELYAWHPEGIQRSALARLLSERRLGVTATARNWSTVTKLLELAGGEPGGVDAMEGGRRPD